MSLREIEILGWEMLLLALGTDPRRFGDLVHRYASWIARYFEALAMDDVDVVMVHDDMVWGNGPFYRHDWYREGAEYLIRAQLRSGAWRGGGRGGLTNTCFALLFLRRATTPVRVPKAVTPEAE